MKKRIVSLLLALVMLLSLLPLSVSAAVTLDDYFDGLPLIAETEPGSPNSTNKWKATTLDGETVLMSGNKGKSNSSSTLQLTFTSATHLTFEYKVSSEARYDKCTITLGSKTLVNGESGDQDWKALEIDVAENDVLKVVYKKDPTGYAFDDCVYLRNFSAGTPLVVTFHANNGTEDTLLQNVYGGKATLKANTFTCEGKLFAGWAAAADGEILYADGAQITTETDMDLYAVWVDAFTVTFDDGSGNTTQVLVPQNAAIGSKLPQDPTKKGYTFGGWFLDDSRLTVETVISSDVTYTAKWTANQYTIAFDANGGSGTMDSVTAVYGEALTLPDVTFTRAGYEFNGWATYAGASYGTYNNGDSVQNLSSDNGATVTLYATWRGVGVNVTVDLNYEGAEVITRVGVVGSNYNYIKTDKGAQYSSISDPVRTGYIFDGWYDAAEGGNEVSTTYKFTAEDAENGFRMYAHWIKGITVHFDGNGYTKAIADKTVTPDKVYSSLPYLTASYYPSNKALDGWYVKNDNGTFGEAVTKDTVFTGDEVTLIAKWRDYQYVIKFNIKYSDQTGVTGTMAAQVAPFGKDVTLNPCTYAKEGYDFSGWSDSSNGSTVKYADGATINRAWDPGDYWDDGSEDNESYNLYAVWTEVKSPEQQEADQKLEAAETAISGTYNPTYGKDTNALTMIEAKLTAAEITDVTVSMKEAAYSSYNYVGIAADGTLQYKWNSNGTTTAASGTVRPTVVLTYKTYTKDSTECLFNMGLDEEKAMAALNAVADRITLPETVEKAEDLTTLPKYPLKEGVDASSVDYSTSNDLELWSTASWTSDSTAVIAVSNVDYPYFSPYKATVSLPEKDTTVTLTMSLVYNGREDLSVSRVYTVLVKGTKVVRELDYNELLDTALAEVGLTNPRDDTKIDNNNLTSDIQFPTTKDLNRIAYRDYEKSFDGKYTPILLCTDNSDVIISADPATANVARMVTYRPLPGQEAATVTVTVKILSRPSGEGKDYDSMTVLASKDITFTVQPLTQEELDTAAAFMEKVCTEEVYWEGIRKANSDRDQVKGDLRSFIEIVPDGDSYKFIRNMDDYKFNGVEADDIPGWSDSEQYRCFRSSVPTVISHENLLLTQPKYNTKVTIDSLLTYTEYAKYYEKFRDDSNYAQFAKFYQQPISTTVTVIGTEGIEDPSIQPMSVTVSVEGSSWNSDFEDLKDATYTCTTGDHRSAANALFAVLTEKGYSYTGTDAYVSGITSPNGTALTAGDETYGPWSGWMFTINGEAPTLGTDSETGDTIYATLATYELQPDDVMRVYYVECATADGNHAWNEGEVTKAATCTEDGEMTFTCTVCSATKTETIAAGHSDYQYTDNNDGTHKVTCGVCSAVIKAAEAHVYVDGTCPCGAKEQTGPTEVANMTVGTQLALNSDLSILFRVKNVSETVYDLSTASLVVEKDQYPAGQEKYVKTTTMTEYSISGGRVVFTYAGITAAEMNDEIRATFYVKGLDGKLYCSPVKVTSICGYVRTALDSGTCTATLRTCLIDMLNYGTAAQIYFGRHTDGLANAEFEEYQQYATAELTSAVESVKDSIATGCTNNLVEKFSAKLDMNSSVGIIFTVTGTQRFTEDELANLKLVVKDESGKVLDTIEGSALTLDTRGRIVGSTFVLTARQMRTPVYTTLYKNGEIASNTSVYSIASYLIDVQTNMPGSTLESMIRAMIIYGDAADKSL